MAESRGSIRVVMPHMGESVVEGKILRWLKREGDAVRRDETIAEVETAKADVEIPAPEDAVLVQILAREGETVAVGADIAVLAAGGAQAAPAPPSRPEAQRAAEPPPRPEAQRAAPEPPPAPVRVPLEAPATVAIGAPVEEEREATAAAVGGARAGARPEPAPGSPARPRQLTITPVVAKLMERHGLGVEDLQRIEGTGAGGRVTKQDVLGYLLRRGQGPERPAPVAPTGATVTPIRPAPAPAPVAPAAERVPSPAADEPIEEQTLTGLRKAIAEHMVRSKRTAPHVTTVAEVDMTTLVALRDGAKTRFQSEEGIPLTYMPFFVKATCAGLRAFPAMNASLVEDRILVRRYYHIGIAVATPAGLVVPVIRHADRLGFRELAHAIHRLAAGARERKLSPDALEGGTFTISNPGAFGGVLSTPIIHQPQAAILNVQAIRKVPMVRDDRIEIGATMFLCLSYDHRIVDGATAVQFLQAVRHDLESPLAMLLQ